jgi:serine/threonine protein kinase
MREWFCLTVEERSVVVKDRVMDETKSLTQTGGSQSSAPGSGCLPDETKSLTHTEAWRPPAPGTIGSSDGDPSEIGRYRVIQRLGQGGFGRVYLGHDDDLDRPAAIKVPNPERVIHPDDVEAFFTEARVLAKLDHPHIVPVFDVGRTEDGLCFVVSKLVAPPDVIVSEELLRDRREEAEREKLG